MQGAWRSFLFGVGICIEDEGFGLAASELKFAVLSTTGGSETK